MGPWSGGGNQPMCEVGSGWALRSLLTQTSLWLCDSANVWLKSRGFSKQVLPSSQPNIAKLLIPYSQHISHSIEYCTQEQCSPSSSGFLSHLSWWLYQRWIAIPVTQNHPKTEPYIWEHCSNASWTPAGVHSLGGIALGKTTACSSQPHILHFGENSLQSYWSSST